MKKEKITIGLFIDAFYPMVDGVISVVDNYAKRLLKYADVIVFAPIDKMKLFDDSTLPYKIVRCKSFKIPIFDYNIPIPIFDKKFKKEIKNSKLDIVHIHSPFMIGKIGIKYAKRNNIPSLATMHSQFKQDIQKICKNKYVVNLILKIIINVFNRCDECYAVNSEVARIFYEDYEYKTLPKVLNNATDLIPVKNTKAANKFINDKYNIDTSEKVFLFVGRLNVLKNILFIVDSLKYVVVKEPNLKFKMLFVGTGSDKEILINHINKHNLKNNIILCGKITNREILSLYYNRADLFLFPSVYDASSLVQIEAASQKTPTIFLKNTATAFNITDGVNGFLSNNNVEAFAVKIIEVMNNKRLYNKVSKGAFKDLYKNWDDAIKEVLNIYMKMIKNKRF